MNVLRGHGIRRRVRRRIRLIDPRGLAVRRWTLRSLARTRTELSDRGMAVRTPPAPVFPAWSALVVERELDRADATCLQRCLVMQAWFAGQGRDIEIVVAVPRTGAAEFTAHAWLRGYDPDEFEKYRELTVLAPAHR